MRLFTLMIIVLVFVLGNPQKSEAIMQDPSWTKEQQSVWRTIEQWNDAFEANDVERYFSYVHPDIVVITPSSPYRVEGIAADRREFEFGIEKGLSRVGFFQELQPHVSVVGEMAVATYYSRGWYGDETNGQIVFLRETDVLKKVDGRWMLFHIHVSLPPGGGNR